MSRSLIVVLLLSDSDAFDLHYGVGVLRVPGGMDTHKVTDALLDSTDDTLDDLDQDSIDEGQFLRLRVAKSSTDFGWNSLNVKSKVFPVNTSPWHYLTVEACQVECRRQRN